MQSKSQAEIDYLKEQLKKNDLANVDFDIDLDNIGDSKEVELNLKEVQQYLKNDILKSDLKHLNDLTAFFYEEEHKKAVDSVAVVEVLLKLDLTGVFGTTKLFEALKFNVKEFVVNYMQEKKLELLDPESLSCLIVSLAKALIEKCN